MSTVLDDVTSESINAAYVQQRVDDWVHRIRLLYDELKAVVPDSWTIRTAVVTMDEELMRKFHVSPVSVHSISFAHDSNVIARLKPRGLWVIGANGRLDLTVREKRFHVIDLAESFAHPDWRVCPANDRLKRELFSPDWFINSLQ